MKKSTLCATTALQAVALLGMGFAATPAFAQTQPTPPAEEADEAAAQADPNAPAPAAPAAGTAVDTSGEEVITVTGSILRRTNDRDSVAGHRAQLRNARRARHQHRRRSDRSAFPPTTPARSTQGWNTGFNFASGANAPALRGLTVQATLSIFDGLRMAPYPLADDGQRNFVDLNTIPNAIIDRIEVLRDGASSTYGADAIAGVINVITKKEIQGLHLNASCGISQRRRRRRTPHRRDLGLRRPRRAGLQLLRQRRIPEAGRALGARPRLSVQHGRPGRASVTTPARCMHNLNWNGCQPEMGSSTA